MACAMSGLSGDMNAAASQSSKFGVAATTSTDPTALWAGAAWVAQPQDAVTTHSIGNRPRRHLHVPPFVPRRARPLWFKTVVQSQTCETLDRLSWFQKG